MINKKIMTFKVFLIYIMLIVLNSCASHKTFINQEIEGTYIQKDDNGIHLQINKCIYFFIIRIYIYIERERLN